VHFFGSPERVIASEGSFRRTAIARKVRALGHRHPGRLAQYFFDGYRFCSPMKPFCGTHETALKQIGAKFLPNKAAKDARRLR
jgi:hypothetical protein